MDPASVHDFAHCPFCGGDPLYNDEAKIEGVLCHAVGCLQCDVIMGDEDPDNLRLRWNRRTKKEYQR